MKTDPIEARTIRERATGRWLDVLAALAPALAPALARVGRHVPCPVHGGRDGFRLFPDVVETGGGICNTCGTFPDGFALLMWVNRWSFRETLWAVAGALGVGADVTPPPVPPTGPAPRPRADTREAALTARNRVWAQSLDPADRRAGPLRAYLARRCLAGVRFDPDVVRFHPALGYWERNRQGEPELLGRYPAMAARVCGADGETVTLHRTYLTAEGQKAPVPSPKKLMGCADDRLVGGAIRLFAPESILGVAEGIETALAVHLRIGVAVWSGVSAALMARLEPPVGASLVVIWADRDRSGAGEAAARILRERLFRQGISVAVHLPPGPLPAGVNGIDWADVWIRGPDRAAA